MGLLTKGIILRHYKRKDIQQAILEHVKDREVGIRYDEEFGKRPDILNYPRDILELALRNATSLHASEERWSNPLALSSDLSRKELDELRIGWDLVLDIDCAIFEYSRICAELVIKFLQYCGVADISCKFSGNKGFHIGVPFEAFPQEVNTARTKDLFPEAPKKIAYYVKENIKEELARQILAFEKNNIARVKEQVNLPQEKITRYEALSDGTKVARLDVDPFLEIDTVLISSRHLYRTPFSLHEKSGLASIPIDPDRVLQFEKWMASPEKLLAPTHVFLNRKVTGESARRLLLQALDFEFKAEQEEEIKPFTEITFTSPITAEFFPPCIQNILQGLEDGKKRGIFCLMNYLGKIGWSKDQIQAFLTRWNKEKNPEPLREVYLKGQLNHFMPGAKLPPNCDNDAYYTGIRVCAPDALCQKIKNPVNYTVIKWRCRQEGTAKEKQSSKKA